jgi:hypothetical protein
MYAMLESMFKNLTVCYSVYFEGSYKECSGLFVAEVILSVAAAAILLWVLLAFAKKTKPLK